MCTYNHIRLSTAFLRKNIAKVWLDISKKVMYIQVGISTAKLGTVICSRDDETVFIKSGKVYAKIRLQNDQNDQMVKSDMVKIKDNYRMSPKYVDLFRPEDHWSCIAHLSAEDMLKSAVIEEKKFKHSPWARAGNPLGPKL